RRGLSQPVRGSRDEHHTMQTSAALFFFSVALYPTPLRPEKPCVKLCSAIPITQTAGCCAPGRERPQAIPLAFPAAEFHTYATFSYSVRKKKKTENNENVPGLLGKNGE